MGSLASFLNNNNIEDYKNLEITNIAVYFCDPHSPWQRGSNENTNGLVRQYLPKGTDLSGYSQEQLDANVDQINNRPRKGLGVRSPLAVYRELLINSPQHSTLVH
jgi:IS30 family transposase